MKVAYNACYGGFGLSRLALVNLAELKDVDLTGMEYNYGCFNNEDYSNVFEAPKDRADKDLISTIEKLGERANGMCANLVIKEIPDGANFEIDEHDGYESVVPPRASWS